MGVMDVVLPYYIHYSGFSIVCFIIFTEMSRLSVYVRNNDDVMSLSAEP